MCVCVFFSLEGGCCVVMIVFDAVMNNVGAASCGERCLAQPQHQCCRVGGLAGVGVVPSVAVMSLSWWL